MFLAAKAVITRSAKEGGRFGSSQGQVSRSFFLPPLPLPLPLLPCTLNPLFYLSLYLLPSPLSSPSSPFFSLTSPQFLITCYKLTPARSSFEGMTLAHLCLFFPCLPFLVFLRSALLEGVNSGKCFIYYGDYPF